MRENENLTCREAVRLLASYLDDELEDRSRSELEEHLRRCRSCYSRHQFEKTLKRQLADLGREPVRPEFEERIRSLVTRFTEDGSGGADRTRRTKADRTKPNRSKTNPAKTNPTKTNPDEENPWSS